jgi:hypothetical protein
MPVKDWPKRVWIDVRAHLSGEGAADDRDAQHAAETLALRAEDFATYAILSNNAYRREKPLPLPQGWTEATEKRFDPGKGLAYAVFEQRIDDRVTKAVVAFRGTDDARDWVHNLTPFHEQMPDAQRAFEIIARDYLALDAEMCATGHSLGGGLALHMALAFPKRVEAIAFNSSPVVCPVETPNVENPRTSIWESGEILEIARELKSDLRFEWGSIELIEVDFDKNHSPLKQHKMEPLAYNLVRLAALRSPRFRQLLDKLEA